MICTQHPNHIVAIFYTIPKLLMRYFVYHCGGPLTKHRKWHGQVTQQPAALYHKTSKSYELTLVAAVVAKIMIPFT